MQAKPKRLRFDSNNIHKVHLECFLFAYFLKSAFGIHHGVRQLDISSIYNEILNWQINQADSSQRAAKGTASLFSIWSHKDLNFFLIEAKVVLVPVQAFWVLLGFFVSFNHCI